MKMNKLHVIVILENISSIEFMVNEIRLSESIWKKENGNEYHYIVKDYTSTEVTFSGNFTSVDGTLYLSVIYNHTQIYNQKYEGTSNRFVIADVLSLEGSNADQGIKELKGRNSWSWNELNKSKMFIDELEESRESSQEYGLQEDSFDGLNSNSGYSGYNDPNKSNSVKSEDPPNRLTPTVPDTSNITVNVYYATDRAQKIKLEKISYSNSRGDLSYGMCKVNIPMNKEKGDVPRPTWWKLEFKENLNKHVVLLEIEPVNVDAYFTSISSKVASSPDRDIFVFIHGYNVSFESGVMRAAQIAFDLGFKGVPITYSWPSRGSLGGYFSDEDNVQYSVGNIISFLKSVRDRTGAIKIHLIAHSMGNRALTRALIELQNENFYNSFVFNQIILAAPDIDADIFLRDIAPRITNCSSRITLYASSQDKALAMSRNLRGNTNRAGESGDHIICYTGIDTIDASRVEGNFWGHSYFADSEPLLHDMYMLITHGHPPGKRNLTEVNSLGKVYWKL
jgi:esterase/lipase superfamily enzyme